MQVLRLWENMPKCEWRLHDLFSLIFVFILCALLWATTRECDSQSPHEYQNVSREGISVSKSLSCFGECHLRRMLALKRLAIDSLFWGARSDLNANSLARINTACELGTSKHAHVNITPVKMHNPPLALCLRDLFAESPSFFSIIDLHTNPRHYARRKV